MVKYEKKVNGSWVVKWCVTMATVIQCLKTPFLEISRLRTIGSRMLVNFIFKPDLNTISNILYTYFYIMYYH